MRVIQFSPPDISDYEINAVVDVLKSGWITTGQKTKDFEKEISQYCQTYKTVCLNSATACMELTLRLLGIGEGDEVITSAYTYTASASVICHVGAKPVLIDTSDNSFQMDYDKLSEAVTSRTKAVIPVDIAGVMCDYDRIMSIAEDKKSLFIPSKSNDIQEALGRVCVLADAAHSFGGVYNGKNNGTIADFTAFSFHAVKNLTTAEGGAVTWNEIDGINSDEIYKRFMLLSLHGQSKDALAKSHGTWEYDILNTGYKCNMPDLMAGLGLAQLKRYAEMLKRRHQMIGIYNDGFKNFPIQALDHKCDGANMSSAHLYLTRLPGKDISYRNTIIQKMSENGVACNVHFKPLPMHTAYKNLGFDIKDFPNAYDMYQNEITLPLHTKLSDEDIEYVIQAMIKSI